MKIEYDNNKNQKNIDERALSFDEVENFIWESAVLEEDTRKQYPERRFIASGFLNARLHIICFTRIKGGIRVISFRKANKREVKSYEKKKAANR